MANAKMTVRFHAFGGYRVRVILARSVARTGRALGAEEDLTGAKAACITTPGETLGYVVLPLEPDEATIAHESSHAVRAMLECLGASLDDETFSYHLDYLVGKIHAFLKRRTR